MLEKTDVSTSLMINNPLKDFNYTANSITSKVVFDNGRIRDVFFALDQGEQLTEHAVPKAALITLIEGNLKFNIEGKDHDLKPGDVIYLAPKARHSVEAILPSKFNLVMIEL